ncbi:ArsR family transcriptional regulator [Halobacteria archaeon AArc-curdl1]|uniref:ArsR family transcriptional regulator n=1 Tax=Natronosalvus hydrolyticus TaxID=2979988 RepID=A0AAP2Z9M6_9EURY|nr:ArsR family transcriptional regulator [Halobacteria archaeon AArc-curdl1]
MRRRILTALVEANPRKEDEFSPEDFATTDERLDKFLVKLQHTHLPKLAESGFIEWDQETETITRGPRHDEIAPLIELMMAHEDELFEDWS